jgi:two-component system chemotaxis sensor kinase CheA
MGGVQRGGMIVRQVLDVSNGTLIERDVATDGLELALVKEKLTLVHREFGVKAKAAWQEVA